MAELLQFETSALPDHFKWQILSFLRAEWPDGFGGENLYRDWITQPRQHPVNFILVEGDLLISHCEVVWKELEHEGVTYKTYGLSGMFTYPSFRKKGYGMQIAKACKTYIENSDGDICLFPSAVGEFYEKAGFERTRAKLFEGSKENSKEVNDPVFMLFLSEKGKQGRSSFENKPIYFGEGMW